MCKHFTKYIAFSAISIFFSISIIQAQVDTLWTKTFGGNGNDEGRSVLQTVDGGYIITGYTRSFGIGGSDIWLIKTNESGDSIWTKTFGGINNEIASSVQQTVDRGYIITGTISSFGVGGSDIWLIKTNESGDTLWTKTFGGGDIDLAYSIQQTADEGYIVAGQTNSFGQGKADAWLIKTNANGDTIWTKVFGGIKDEEGCSVQQTTDGGYVVMSNTYSFSKGFTDVWLIKTNTDGDTMWTNTFGGSDIDLGYLVRQTKDEGYVIIGKTNSFGAGGSDIWLIKTNASGDTLWTKTFGEGYTDWGYSVQQTKDEGYILTGYTNSFGVTNIDILLVKTDASGNTLWIKTINGNEYGYDIGYSVQQTTDDGYIITGYKEAASYDNWDLWLIKTTPDTFATKINKPNKLINLTDFELEQNYPNPFNPNTTIEFSLPKAEWVTLKVFNILGQKVATLVSEKVNPGVHKYKWQAENLPSGIYYCRMQAGEFEQVRKMILLK